MQVFSVVRIRCKVLEDTYKCFPSCELGESLSKKHIGIFYLFLCSKVKIMPTSVYI